MNLLPPNDAVSTMSDPASKYSRAICRISPGRVAFNSSGHPPGSRPRACSHVPVAPSEMMNSPALSLSIIEWGATSVPIIVHPVVDSSRARVPLT